MSVMNWSYRSVTAASACELECVLVTESTHNVVICVTLKFPYISKKAEQLRKKRTQILEGTFHLLNDKFWFSHNAHTVHLQPANTSQLYLLNPSSTRFAAYTAKEYSQNVILMLSLQNGLLPTAVRMFWSCIQRHCPAPLLPWWEGSCAVSCSRPPLSFPRQSQPSRLLQKDIFCMLKKNTNPPSLKVNVWQRSISRRSTGSLCLAEHICS